MTIPKRKEQHGGQSKTDIKLEDPSLYQPESSLDSHWQELQFVSNLPVIKARIGINSSEHDIQCMIDSGKTKSFEPPFSSFWLDTYPAIKPLPFRELIPACYSGCTIAIHIFILSSKGVITCASFLCVLKEGTLCLMIVCARVGEHGSMSIMHQRK